MKKLILSSLFITSILNAQFTITGKINNYENKRVIVKINKAFDALLIGNITTDSKGAFKIPVKEKYTGIIDISLFDAKQNLPLIADNTNIDFVYTLTSDNNIIVEKSGNSINETYKNYINYNSRKDILPKLKSISNNYNTNDEFYLPLQKEITNLDKLKSPDITPYPFLQYYVNTLDLINSTDNITSENKNSILNNIEYHFLNAGEEFESDGLERGLLYSYFKILADGAKNQQVWTSRIDNSLTKLLENLGEDTQRGQEILAASINYFNIYSLDDLATKYLSRAESLTCEISPELKNTIDKNNNIKVGKKAPNVKFTHKIEGKYNNLYDIKSKYKLVMIWASWCGHCQQELPSVKLFYDNFKKSGGEIIALSVDYDEKSWKDTIKHTSWLNDSDLLYWDSSFVKEFNVSGTPTFLLLDKDNKILQIAYKITDIKI